MKTLKFLIVLMLLLSMTMTVVAAGPGGSGGTGGGSGTGNGGGGGSGGGGGHTETFGNNLSYPVIWAEGVEKTLQGTPGMEPILTGEWWYQWGTNGTDPNIVPASCEPDPDESNMVLNPNGDPFCNDFLTNSLTRLAGVPAADNPLPLTRAYIQKDQFNVWQAWSGTASAAGVANSVGGVDVHWIDWGDNLESVPWTTQSQVRTEVVLFQDLPEPFLEYEMRHTSGWGINEVHGLAADLTATPLLASGTRGTVYSNCARLTIQKLLVPREDTRLADLIWVPGEGWTEPEGYEANLINPHIFNGSVHEGGDGPGYYSAEINVKGRIIYGYTWSVRKLNDMTPVAGSSIPTAAGDYRLTFSLDQQCGAVGLQTYFVEGTTQIIVPVETEEAVSIASSGDSEGGTAVLVPAVFDENGALTDGNLTYIDVRIVGKSGGKRSLELASDCVQLHAWTLELEQQMAQMQNLCPGGACPCSDLHGNGCEMFRTQTMNMLRNMEHLQFAAACETGECACRCLSGDGCLEMQTQLQTLMQLHTQLRTQCTSGACLLDSEFTAALETELEALIALFDAMEQGYNIYLPSLPVFR